MAESLKREVEASGFELWRIAAALQLRNSTFSSWLVDTTLPDEKREKAPLYSFDASRKKSGRG